MYNTNFFGGRIHVHSLKHLFKRIPFFHCTIVSEVHAQYPQDTHFRSPSKVVQIANFKMGRTSTLRYHYNAPKIVAVDPVDPEIVRSELCRRNL